MIQSSQFKRMAAASIQIAILLFLQVYSLLPILHHSPAPVRHGAVCRGDHRLCGCPLEKIINRTCCCFKSAEMQMNISEHLKKKGLGSNSESTRSLRIVCPPCGSHQDSEFTSLEDIKYIRFPAIPEGPGNLWVPYLPQPGGKFQTWVIEPPAPPPKSIIA